MNTNAGIRNNVCLGARTDTKLDTGESIAKGSLVLDILIYPVEESEDGDATAGKIWSRRYIFKQNVADSPCIGLLLDR